MMDYESFESAVVVIAGILLIHKQFGGGPHRPMDFPPGPRSWPFVGALHRLYPDPFTASRKLLKEYGPVVGLDYGPYRAVILYDYKMMKQAFTTVGMQGRPTKMPQWKNKYREMDEIASAGILHAEDRNFRQHHNENVKFVLDTFQYLGPKKFEKIILNELTKIFDIWDIRAKQGRELGTVNLFEPHASNILWTIFAARKMPENPNSWNPLKVVDGLFGAKQFEPDSTTTILSMLSSWLKLLTPRVAGWFEFDRNYEQLKKIIGTCLHNHERDPCRVESEKDFIDIYVDKMVACYDPESVNYRATGDLNLISMIGDLLIAGLTPTAATLTWAIAIVANIGNESRVMKKLHEELDSVTEKDGLITLEHRPKMPYTDAFLMEVLRYRPALPWAFPHFARDYTKIAKYNIPQWTIIFMDKYTLFQDPKIFPDPEEFKPERFLSEDGKNQKKVIEEFIPFSMDNRLCPGKALAEDVMFLILANLLKRYEIRVDERIKEKVLEHQPHFVLIPKTFYFRINRRS